MTVEAPEIDEAGLADLRDTVRQVCDDAGGTLPARRLAEEAGPGHDEALWEVLARQIGIAGVGLPESAGGGGGLAEIAAVCEELGRVLAPVPFLSSSVLAGQVLARCGAAGEKALRRVAAGEIHALVCADADGAWRPGRPPAAWTLAGLEGRAPFVLDGATATGLVVAASGPEGVDLALVEPAAEGVDVRSMRTLDPSRPQAAVTFTGVRAQPLTTGGTGERVLAQAFDVALVALAAEQLGGAQACLDMTVQYVRERRQFGRAVGSFQAVKHTCADLLLRVETARSAVARAVRAGSVAEPAEAAVAAVWCADAFAFVAAECLQLHGGMGFTWEHDAHLYLRRARADAALLGGSAHHKERLATLLAW
ncbi:acyl-CoA dehydrogenase family protein [Nonomuraea sp. NPDC049480]|uniref:acyl-CoA dehydrogenase family protein n=1 Tax=Nonomuraea sp. NPDC049480 TaxID=3364353 RepID=UPI00378E5963